MKRFALPAAVSSVVVLSFVILEYVNTEGFKQVGFPAALFGLLWVLTFFLVGLLQRSVLDIRSGNGFNANRAGFVLCAVLMIMVAVMWSGIVTDQIPCFIGVANCD